MAELRARKFRKGRKLVFYQPKLEDLEWGVLLFSFQVYASKQKARRDFPRRQILEFKEGEIEEPTFVD